MAARRHRADKDVLVEADGSHSDAVAEDRAARERARWVDTDDADLFAEIFVIKCEFVDERRFAGTRRTGDADDHRLAGVWIDGLHQGGSIVGTALDGGDRTGDGTRLAVEQFCKGFEGGHSNYLAF